MTNAPRTLSLLYDSIEKDYAWRITELSNFKSVVLSERNPKAQNALIRAGVALLYAHWEGFVKRIADLYYEFVSYQDCKIGDLNNSFSSIVLRGEVERLMISKKLKEHHILLEKLFEKQGDKAFFPTQSPIRTANLKYDIFEDVCILIGLEISEFENRCKDKKFNEKFDRNIKKMIDEGLVDRRNAIAHGEFLPVKIKEYQELYDAIINYFIYVFKELVIDAAQSKRYLRKPS